MADFSIGDYVRATYKSGVYIGEIMEDRGENFLIKVLAVEKHPMQGDLHHPKQVEGVFFHQRKALAKNEKANVLKSAVFSFEADVPPYRESLLQAIDKLKEQLQSKETAFNKKALTVLEALENNDYKKSFYQ
ncbi:kinase-associated protein B [Oceanobacillus limi]|uniref:Kinase-associated protein B n=1 Tax=Oceanobacillus limi TaxID=930131 RepID=A0A1I0DN27_9BACI|nr:kinase-associated lipoprotein B [Oceanobacillus limi]SET33938.1 kinase-associated protein B [Oceanobacillus limi]